MPLDGTGFNPVYEALDRAEASILRHGWRKGRLGEKGAPSCVIGAIQQAVAELGVWNGLELRWEACSCYGVAIGVPCVEIWNDRPERCLADVLDGFERAKALACEQRVAV